MAGKPATASRKNNTTTRKTPCSGDEEGTGRPRRFYDKIDFTIPQFIKLRVKGKIYVYISDPSRKDCIEAQKYTYQMLWNMQGGLVREVPRGKCLTVRKKPSAKTTTMAQRGRPPPHTKVPLFHHYWHGWAQD
ncbi:UNVERIFIED_CONTAM: hypothetical protein K2H54_008619 [Gekko kuhli]